MYDGKKLYGPYTRADGRQIVVLRSPGGTRNDNDQVTVSYPKYLMEMKLGRYLEEDETIDHIDEDFRNNDLSNLRILKRSDHSRSHAVRRIPTKHICPVCGKPYKQQKWLKKTCGNKHCTWYYPNLPLEIRLQHEAELLEKIYISQRDEIA